ncbi:hypothetical protein [[Clostridium] polysaccharolyticum]|uniref:ASCH domain-containing protein n=1 Tax=[Clostridium] polysaccharolyticum TaxID=29364 RepID=A0A1I0CMY2_9FIRM|nr:hypothetical protein [[Clostridium] polysaccharolyticum]SET20599.1 hypothetical protein SAMN04487772_11081 [[Clostridium] polysaccharolyticum]
MKQILLSMQPFWKEKIMSGEKIYEYRTRFTDEEVIAYLYVSAPVYGIAGILHLGKKIYLDDWLEKYKDNPEVVSRIMDYKSRKNVVTMPVLSYQETNLITRAELEVALGKFVWPQSYYFLKDDMELTKYIEEHICFVGDKKENCFDNESVDDICKNYR